MSDFTEFMRLAAALKPWRDQLVFVGGWAHRLYRLHPMAATPNYLPLATRDADVAFADRAKLEGNMQEALTKAGFSEELIGEHNPPVTRYTLGEEDAGFYAEFLTPLQGSRLRRNGEPNKTLLKAGVTAQKLRHLEILLMFPWQLLVPLDEQHDAVDTADVRIPNPVSFVAQKILIHKERPSAKRAQDVLYIHDTLELFAERLPVLSETWTQHVSRELTDKQRRGISEGTQEMFSAVTDTIRDAARMPLDRSMRPDRMQAFCAQALNQLFG